jgi:hypothetical protein
MTGDTEMISEVGFAVDSRIIECMKLCRFDNIRWKFVIGCLAVSFRRVYKGVLMMFDVNFAVVCFYALSSNLMN